MGQRRWILWGVITVLGCGGGSSTVSYGAEESSSDVAVYSAGGGEATAVIGEAIGLPETDSMGSVVYGSD